MQQAKTTISKNLINRGLLLSLLPGIVLGLALILPVQTLAMETNAREAFLMDFETGAVLYDKDGNTPMPPASMSKLMTVYMVMERLKDGRLKMDDKFRVSENAWRKGGAKSGSSTMFLEPGSLVRVEDLLRGIIIQSGNDACIVVAEALSGKEETFAEEMNRKATELGLTNSSFANATGWPHPDQRMSPRDLATLTRRTINDFPEFFHFYSEKSFIYNGIRQSNRNPLLYKKMGADGMKTGHTSEAGFGLTATAKRGERRLILVVNGLPSVKARASEPERILEWGFREFNNYALFKGGEKVADANVWLGDKGTVPLMIEKPMKLTMPRKARKDMKVTVSYKGPISAPIEKGAKVADLIVTAKGQEPVVMPLVAGETVEQLGLVGRLVAAFKFIVFGNSG